MIGNDSNDGVLVVWVAPPFCSSRSPSPWLLPAEGFCESADFSGIGRSTWWQGVRWWFFTVPHPFVRPGHPHLSPLPPRGRGDFAHHSAHPSLGSRPRIGVRGQAPRE